MAQWNSDGYIFIDFKDVNFSLTNQTIAGIYQRMVDIVGTNKFILVLNANGRTPMPGTVSVTNGQYVIDTVIYMFSISSNDNLFIRRQDIPAGNIIDDTNISINSTYSSYKIDNTYQKKLTAGDNITISDDTISATDTTYTAGANVSITDGVISATDTTYTPGTNVSISADNVISATAATYTAGANVSINDGVISATDTTYTAGTNVSISADNVISATDTTYTAGTGIDITSGTISCDATAAEIPYSTGVSVADKLDNVPTFNTLTTSDNNKLLGVSVVGSDISVGAVDPLNGFQIKTYSFNFPNAVGNQVIEVDTGVSEAYLLGCTIDRLVDGISRYDFIGQYNQSGYCVGFLNSLGSLNVRPYIIDAGGATAYGGRPAKAIFAVKYS